MRQTFNHFSTRLRRFASDTRGTFAVVFGVTSVLLMMGAGFALDTGQMVLVRSNLLNALDSAVTSTARDLTTGAAKSAEDDRDIDEVAREIVEAFLFANAGTGFASVDKIKLDDVHVDPNRNTVTAQASVDVALVFPFFGSDPVKHIVVESAAVYSDKQIEVAMMLDVTGSMDGDKIADLKVAATNAVTTLLGGQSAENPRIRIALVPYAAGVNTGGLYETVFKEQEGESDLPPPVGEPVTHVACATERKMQDGSADYSDDGPDTWRPYLDGREGQYPALVNSDDRLDVCPTANVIPLTADQTKLEGAIAAFEAGGFTAGGIAAQWGYYMLSPKWRTAIDKADLGDGPADYDDEKVAKVAILMTDGAFNTAFAGSTARKNAEQICANMQDDGIQVFTIGFALPVDEESNARLVLKNCATPDSGGVQHFHEAADGEELDAVLQEIAANVERLYLTK